MKQSVILSTTAGALFTYCFYLLILLTNAPDLDELMLNEQTYYKTLNEELVYKFYESYDDIKTNVAKSTKRRIREAGTAAAEHMTSFEQALSYMEKAYQFKLTPDSIKKNIYCVNILAHNMTGSFSARIGKKFTRKDVEFHSKTEALMGTYLCKIENEMVSNYSEVINVYLDDTDMCLWWQPIEEVIMKYDVVTWISDTINFSLPITIRSGVKERARLRLSKKFVNHLVDSLETTGRLRKNSLSVQSRVSVNLISNQFAIEAFQDEEQGISERTYTTWEFGLTPLTPGKKDITLLVGIVLSDQSKKQFVKYYQIPIAEVNVL